jgi:hypothetical protein
MTSHMTHLRAQHHIADLRRETHAAVSRRRRGAASSVNPGFLGRPRPGSQAAPAAGACLRGIPIARLPAAGRLLGRQTNRGVSEW